MPRLRLGLAPLGQSVLVRPAAALRRRGPNPHIFAQPVRFIPLGRVQVFRLRGLRAPRTPRKALRTAGDTQSAPPGSISRRLSVDMRDTSGAVDARGGAWVARRDWFSVPIAFSVPNSSPGDASDPEMWSYGATECAPVRSCPPTC